MFRILLFGWLASKLLSPLTWGGWQERWPRSWCWGQKLAAPSVCVHLCVCVRGERGASFGPRQVLKLLRLQVPPPHRMALLPPRGISALLSLILSATLIQERLTGVHGLLIRWHPPGLPPCWNRQMRHFLGSTASCSGISQKEAAS